MNLHVSKFPNLLDSCSKERTRFFFFFLLYSLETMPRRTLCIVKRRDTIKFNCLSLRTLVFAITNFFFSSPLYDIEEELRSFFLVFSSNQIKLRTCSISQEKQHQRQYLNEQVIACLIDFLIRYFRAKLHIVFYFPMDIN